MIDVLSIAEFWWGLLIGILATGFVVDRVLKSNAKEHNLRRAREKEENARHAKEYWSKVEEVAELAEENRRLKARIKKG
ncbi:hypothetical protein IPM44_03425 [bacterium]|nr:MAG: hypothetical protein IPM44_03425 [bacterium]